MATRTLQEAESALKSGGLTGRTLEMALASLRGSYTTPPPQTGAVRDVQFQSGDPASSLTQSRSSSSQVAESVDPYISFNKQIVQMLTRAQGARTNRFVEQGLNAQQEQNKRVSKKTDSSLIGASPSIQSDVRSAQAGALDPTIDQAEIAHKTFEQRIGNFKDAIDAARAFKDELETANEKKRSRAAEVVQLAIEQGSEGLSEMLRTSPEIFKAAGYNTKEFEAILTGFKKREEREAYEFGAKNTPKGDVELTSAQKTTKSSLDAVISAMASYRFLYNSLVEESGGQLIGTRAGSLSGAYNTLLFLIAQAAGTGALQAADREVVENMIPNPTSPSGAFGALVRGGKQGGLNSIDEATQLFRLKRDTLLTGNISYSGGSENDPRGSENDPLGIRR